MINLALCLETRIVGGYSEREDWLPWGEGGKREDRIGHGGRG